MATIGGITVGLFAQIDGFVSDMKRATKLTESSSEQMKKSMMVAGAAIGTAMAGATVAVTKMVADTVQQADKFQKLTDRIGGSTEAFSQLEYVAERSGVKFETLTMGLQRMTRRIGEVAFAGKGEAKDALRELGLEAEHLATLPLDKQFEAVAEELSKVANKSDQTRLAMKLFDSEGVALVQTMQNGAAGIQELREEADRLGLTITSETAAASVELADRITMLRGQAEGFKTQLASGLIPTISELATEFITVGDNANTAREMGETLGQWFRNILSAGVLVKAGFATLGEVIGGFAFTVVETFTTVRDTITEFTANMGTAFALVTQKNFGAAVAVLKQGAVDAGEAWKQGSQNVEDAMQGIRDAATENFTEAFDTIDRIQGKIDPVLQEIVVTAKKIPPVFASQKKAAEDSAKAQEKLAQEFQQLRNALNPLRALNVQYARDLSVLQAQIDEVSYTTREYEEDVVALNERYVEQREQIEGVNDEFENLMDTLFPLEALTRDYERAQEFLNDQLADGELTAERHAEAMKRLSKEYEENKREVMGLKDESEKAFEEITKAIDRMFDDISRNGKLTFNGLLTVFASIADEIAKIAKDTDISFIGKENSIFGDGSLGGFFGSTGGQSVLAAGAGMAANLIVSEFGDEFATNYAEIGSQIGSVIGAIVGSFIPVIGTMLGGALGALAGAIDGTIFGKLFGRDLEVEIGGSGARGADPHDQILHTALGDIYSLRAQGGWGSFFEEGTPGFAMAESLRAFDEAIASLLNNDQLEMVVESLKTWQIEMRKDGVSIETLLNSRFSHILGNFNGLIADYVDGFEHLEDKMEAFGLALASFNLLTAAMEQFINTDPAQAVSDQLREMSKSSTEVLAGFGDALRGLMDNFEGTPEQMQYIAAAIDARYQAEIDYLLAIERLVVSLMQSIQSQQERIGDAIDREVNGARTFEDLFAEATSMMDMLASAESPEQIEEIVSAIQKLVDAAFQALDPSQLVSGGEQLIAFLDEVLALATQRADELRQDAIDESDALRNEVADFAEAFGIPLETTNEAINGVSSEIQVQTEILVGESREQQNLQAQTNQLLADVRDALNQLEGSTGRLAFVPA